MCATRVPSLLATFAASVSCRQPSGVLRLMVLSTLLTMVLKTKSLEIMAGMAVLARTATLSFPIGADRVTVMRRGDWSRLVRWVVMAMITC